MIFQRGIKVLEQALVEHLASRQEPKPSSSPSRAAAEALARSLAPNVRQLWATFNTERSAGLPDYMSAATFSDAYLAAYTLPNVVRIYSLLRSSRALSKMFASEHPGNTLPQQRQPKVKVAGKGNAHRPTPRLSTTDTNKDTNTTRGNSTLVMVDYGAGPLTATLASALALAEGIASRPPAQRQNCTLVSMVVEPSHEAWKNGLHLLSALRNDLSAWGVEVEVRRLPAAAVRAALQEQAATPDWAAQGIQLFVAANVLNELSSPDKRELYRTLVAALDRGAQALVVEPGQDIHARRLAAFRDKLLAEQRNVVVSDPCPHSLQCPLGPTSGRSDWCWFRVPQPLPDSDWIRNIDKHTGLKHDELNYSFAVFGLRPERTPDTTQMRARHQHAEPRSRLWGRVVSDPIADNAAADAQARSRRFRFLSLNALRPLTPEAWEHIRQGKTVKSLVCHHSGALLGVVGTRAHIVDRGQGLAAEPEHLAIIAERTKAPSTEQAGSVARGPKGGTHTKTSGTKTSGTKLKGPRRGAPRPAAARTDARPGARPGTRPGPRSSTPKGNLTRLADYPRP